MKDLHIMINKSKENKQNTQKTNQIPVVVGAVILIISVILIYTGICLPRDKVYTIDDKNYTYSIMNQVIPVKIDLLDAVWGSAVIDSVEEVREYYEMMQALPIAQSANDQILYENTVTGTISFVEGDNINFIAGSYIVIDDVIYGDENTSLSIKSHTDRLCRKLFTKDNLVNMIGSHNRIVLRSEEKRINLSVDQKKKLKEALLESTIITNSEELSKAMRTKGNGVAQIEFYVLDNEEKTPKVYVVLFENGLCMVHDERFIGSIMQLQSDVLTISKEFLEEQE